jgi:hypothetical protein
MLSTVLASVEAEFASVTNAPSFEFGDKYLQVHAMPPRVVWVPQDEPTGPGNLRDESLATTYAAILTRFATVDAMIWGASFAQAEAIAHNIITVWRDKTTGCGTVEAVRWPREGEIGWTGLGMGVVVSLRVEIPVLDKMIEIPDADDEAENDGPHTVVTWVADSDEGPGENEALLSRGTSEFVDEID